MSADPLPWPERLRRRNGLPHRPYPRLSEPDIDGPFSGIPDEYRLLRREPEPRCDLTDLPTTMCHHCQETPDA